MTLPPVTYSADRLQEIRALYGDSCNVLFLSNAALSVMNQAIESMLWATRWHEGKRHQELPGIAKELYEELTMNLCTVEALGEAIGSALSMVITVNNAQTMPCCGGDAGTINDDGTINQPPLYIPPASWGGQLPTVTQSETCKLAYACWEYGEVILSMLEQLRSVVLVLSFIAVVVSFFLPASWAVLLVGGSAASLTAVFAQLTAQSAVLTEAVGAGANWQADKDDIICGFVTALSGSAVDVENQFIAAMVAVYGGLLDSDDLLWVVELVSASKIGDWVQDNLFDGGDFAPLNMPADYVCCPAPPTTVNVSFLLFDAGSTSWADTGTKEARAYQTGDNFELNSRTTASEYGGYALYVKFDTAVNLRVTALNGYTVNNIPNYDLNLRRRQPNPQTLLFGGEAITVGYELLNVTEIEALSLTLWGVTFELF